MLLSRLVTVWPFKSCNFEIDKVVPELFQAERQRSVDGYRLMINSWEFLRVVGSRLKLINLVCKRRLTVAFQSIRQEIE